MFYLCKETIETFINTLDEFNDREFLINTIIYNVAPTLANEKASSLINFHNKHKRNLYKLWKMYKNTVTKELNLKFYELKITDEYVVVLFYNEDKLYEIFKDVKTMKFLYRFGYREKMTLKEKMSLLKRRYEVVCPHEMGVFLGYSLDDVIDFIEYPNKKCLLCGYWKVYNNPRQAEKIFKKYDDIKTKVIQLIINKNNSMHIVNNI